MQVGWHQVFWHRPLAGYLDRRGEPRVMLDAPRGVMTAYDVRRQSIADPIELWPRIASSSPPPASALESSRRRARKPLTFHATTTREFERKYWNTIKSLAMGRFVNKDNADCVLDRVTQRRLRHHHRDLEPLAETLIAHYRALGLDAQP